MQLAYSKIDLTNVRNVCINNLGSRDIKVFKISLAFYDASQ